MYFDPPYLLIVIGLLAGLTSGAAFEATLKEQVQAWAKSRSSRNIAYMKGFRLLVPFLGICLGVALFLTAGLAVFGISLSAAFLFAVITTALIGRLIWSQLGKLLLQLEQGGSRAIDLDIF